MTDDDIIELADKAKLPFWNNSGVPIHLNELRKFAELVLAHKPKPKKQKDICDND
jgi:uncharacterized membrane protein